MWRQNIVLKPTDIELLEEADCTHKLPGVGRGRAADSETRAAFPEQAQAQPLQTRFPRQGR